MSGMDRLTDGELEAMLGYDLHDARGELCRTSDFEDQSWGMSIAACSIVDTDAVVKAMARELLAHRRASQAAPAPQKPVAWAETDHKGKVIGVSMNQYPWHPTPLYAQAAPAPSDGLREALATLLVQANGVEPRDDRLRQNVVRIARAALSTPTEERQ